MKTKRDRKFSCQIQVRHGLLYDVVDTNDELISGRLFPQLLSSRASFLDDWRFFETPALGIVSPRTGEILWVPLPVWFTPSFRHTVTPTLRPSFEEWEAGSYVRELSSSQLHQALRSARQYESGKWHLQGSEDADHYCRHDDCPCGCGAPELTPEAELAEIADTAKYRGTPRRQALAA